MIAAFITSAYENLMPFILKLVVMICMIRAPITVPTTVARKGSDLFLPNARFGIPDPGTAAFSVTRVPVS